MQLMYVCIHSHQSLGQIGCVTEVLNPVALRVLINGTKQTNIYMLPCVCYHLCLVSLLFAVLLSLHFFLLVYVDLAFVPMYSLLSLYSKLVILLKSLVCDPSNPSSTD